MKPFRYFLLTAVIFTLSFSAHSFAQAPLKANGFIIYKQKFTGYTELIEFSHFVDNVHKSSAPPYSVLTNLHSSNTTVDNKGVLAVVHYPGDISNADFQSQYKTNTSLLDSLTAKYSQFKERIQNAKSLWKKAEAAYLQAQKNKPKPTPTPKPTPEKKGIVIRYQGQELTGCKLLTARPDSISVINSSGVATVPLNQIPKATAVALNATSKTQKIDLNWAIKLAKKAAAKKDYKTAENRYTDAINFDPKNIDAFLGRASIYRKIKQSKKAVEDYKKVIAMDSKNIIAYLEQGECYVTLKNDGYAITDFTKVIQLDSSNAQAYFQRAAAYQRTGELTKALADFRKAASLDLGLQDAAQKQINKIEQENSKNKASSDDSQ